MLELTLFLVNILLIIIIITVYVRLSMTIKNQGTRFTVALEQTKEGFKEAMAPAMRLARARKNKDEVNHLLPSWSKQPFDDSASFDVSYRGSDIDHLLRERKVNASAPVEEEAPAPIPAEVTKIDETDIAKAGGEGLESISLQAADPSATVDGAPAVVQSGVMDEPADAEQYTPNPRASPNAIRMGSFMTPNKFGKGRK